MMIFVAKTGIDKNNGNINDRNLNKFYILKQRTIRKQR